MEMGKESAGQSPCLSTRMPPCWGSHALGSGLAALQARRQKWLRLETLVGELPKRMGFSREQLREIAEAPIQKVVAIDIGGGVSAAPEWQSGRVKGAAADCRWRPVHSTGVLP